MLSTLFIQVTIILLALIGVVSSHYRTCFVIVAGISLVLMTVTSFFEYEDSKKQKYVLLVIKLIVIASFSILSGGYFGFVSFMLIDEIKARYRGILSLMLFLVTECVFRQQLIPAMVVLWMLLLLILCGVIYGMQKIIEYALCKIQQEKERLRVANINELHTKQVNDQLVMNNYLVDKNARLMERENISRKIHNSVGHSITAAIMTLDAADMLYDVKPEEARRKMQDANDRIRGSLDSIRRAVRVLDENSKMISIEDLECELQTISDNFTMDTTREVQMDFSKISDDGSIPHEHAEFLTGAFEEMLSNGVRHGQADTFMLVLSGDSAHIRMVVTDNGHGDYNENNEKQKLEQGFGLKKMISYVQRCGGKAEFINSKGFLSMIELPIYENNAEEMG